MFKRSTSLKKIAVIFTASLAIASVATPILNYSLMLGANAEASTLASLQNDNEENSGPVTIKYVGPTGKDLIYPEVVTVKVGDALNITRKNIGMYMVFQGVDGDLNGKFTSDLQTITFRYTHEPVKFTVVSEDEDHNPIADDIVETYDESNPTLMNGSMFKKAGWSIDYDSSTYDEGDQSVTFRQLLDMSGTNDIDELTQVMNDQITTNVTDTHHVWSGPDIVCKAVYKRDVVAGEPLTVKYRDTKGNKIAGDNQFQGNVGQTIDITPKVIDHYNWISGSPQATISDSPTEITLTYEKQSSETDSNDQTNSSNGTTNQNNNATTPKLSQNLANDSKVNLASLGNTKTNTSKSFTNWNSSQLPQGQQSDELPITGMNNTGWLTLLGILSVLAGSLFIFKKPHQSK